MIEIVNGNLLDAKEDVICHQVNCMGVMGAGLAKAIAYKYPFAKKAYVELCERSSPIDLLGTALICIGKDKIVANIFGQYDYGRDKNMRYTDYMALKNGFKKVREFADRYKLSVAAPVNIGCGLANGDWDMVKAIIDKVFDDSKITLYKFEGDL